MYRSADLLYFSPTGNTRRAGLAIASEMAERVNETDLGKCAEVSLTADTVIVAAPVFSGRIPALVSEKLSRLDGRGKTAVTAVVYGVRAYEDALLELNDVMEAALQGIRFLRARGTAFYRRRGWQRQTRRGGYQGDKGLCHGCACEDRERRVRRGHRPGKPPLQRG